MHDRHATATPQALAAPVSWAEAQVWYSDPVRFSSPAFRRLARVVAALLLAWTAVDLTATRLCAADGVAMAATSSEARPDGGDGPASGGPTRQSHIDDCFCCSHCVNVAMPEPLLAVTADTPRDVASRVRIPFDDGHPLYHPPQLF